MLCFSQRFRASSRPAILGVTNQRAIDDPPQDDRVARGDADPFVLESAGRRDEHKVAGFMTPLSPTVGELIDIKSRKFIVGVAVAFLICPPSLLPVLSMPS